MASTPMLNRIKPQVFIMATVSQIMWFGSACKKDPGITVPERLPAEGADTASTPVGADSDKGDAVGAAATPPTQPIVTTPPPPAPEVPAATALVVVNGAYFMRNAASLRCVNIPDNSTDQEIEFEIADCSVRDSQVFFFDNLQNNIYKITNKNSSYSMSIRGLNALVDAILEQYPYAGDPDQQFEITKVKDNYVLRPSTSKLVVTTKDEGAAIATPLVLGKETSSVNQQWILIPIP